MGTDPGPSGASGPSVSITDPGADTSAVLTMDCHGVIVDVDGAAERLLGYPRNRAVGRRVSELVLPARMRDPFDAALRRYRETGETAIFDTPVRVPVVDRTGREVEVEAALARAGNGAGEVLVARFRPAVGPAVVPADLLVRYIADAGRVRVAERRERVEYARLLTLVESLKLGVLLQDADRRVVLTNSAFVEMFDTGSAEPPAARARADEVVRRGRPVFGDEVTLADGRVFERDYVPVTLDGSTLGHLWVFRDVTTHTEVRRTLQERNRVLTEVSALKTEFVAVLSHELRTPLTSIATFAEMLDSGGEPDPADYRAAVGAIRRGAERMLSLVADLVLLARLESGELAVCGGRVDLAALVRAVDPAGAGNVADGPPVAGDEDLLRELLDTVTGVLRGVSAGMELTAAVDTARWTVRVHVRTTEPATTERLLSTRLRHPRHPDEYRTGALALMLARAIATRHGGHLATAVDQTSVTITVTLPTA